MLNSFAEDHEAFVGFHNRSKRLPKVSPPASSSAGSGTNVSGKVPSTKSSERHAAGRGPFGLITGAVSCRANLPFPLGDNKIAHLWVITTEPNTDGIFAVVSFTSLKEAKDQTVILRKAGHPFLKHDMCICYALAELTSAEKLQAFIDQGTASSPGWGRMAIHGIRSIRPEVIDARLKTALELKATGFEGEFGKSPLRAVLFALYELRREVDIDEVISHLPTRFPATSPAAKTSWPSLPPSHPNAN